MLYNSGTNNGRLGNHLFMMATTLSLATANRRQAWFHPRFKELNDLFPNLNLIIAKEPPRRMKVGISMILKTL